MKKLFLVLLIVASFSSTALNAQTGWFLQSTPTTKNLYDIFFINSQTGWACGDSGRIIKTTNGGSIWIELPPFTANKLFAIRFSDANYGYVTGGS